ncbi:MAG TPA: sodium:solute symporter family protein [Verrucomicrobiota bacterium]|nr:sodium:solute symporter family protein [Verrucomicrobiota bacterium]
MSNIPLGPAELGFIAVYLLSLIGIGYCGMRARRENSLKDFYLAGSSIGFLVLVLTLYATQYSGNTLFAFTGKTFRIGYAWLMSVHFMMAIIVVYLVFAPRLHQLAKRESFITPADFLEYRFRHRPYTVLASITMIVAIGNYLLAQLTAMGLLLQGMTTFEPRTAFVAGVILLAVIMLVYETLGGFRAVAWTDVIQGGILMVGFAILLFVVLDHFGGLAKSYEALKEAKPEKVAAPDALTIRRWFSYIVVVGIGGALYPQAIQRIYAARSQRVLRNGVATMAFLPLTASLIAVFVGVTAAAAPELATLTDADSDRVFGEVCRIVMDVSPFHRWLVVVLLAAVLAALMSTADSVLLSISSMLTKDIYHRQINPNASEARLTFIGKSLSWIVVTLMASIAIYLNSLENKPTLVKLMDMKFDMLMQLGPGFIIGAYWHGMKSNAPFWGLLAGLVAIFALYISVSSNNLTTLEEWMGFRYGPLKITQGTLGNWGIHGGIFGLAVNLSVIVAISKSPLGQIPRPTAT